MIIFSQERKRLEMKKIIFLLILVGFTSNVYAKEKYYENNNGVELTKEEYDFLSLMYWEGSQDFMTKEDYEKFIGSNIMNGIITIKESSEIVPYGVTTSDKEKTLKIVSSCITNCTISVTATWKVMPAVKSYDVMGAYLEGTSLINNPTTRITTNLGVNSSNEIKKFSNGFGVSIKLPKYGTSLIINQEFVVSKNGTVYASYQHAKSPISLANSRNYALSRSGYGGVFKFSGTAANTYDRMSGVNITL